MHRIRQYGDPVLREATKEVTDIDGAVIMSVTAAVFTTMTSGAIRDLGAKVRDTARSIEQRIAQHGHAITI